MSWPVALEKRLDPSPWLPYVLTALAIVSGLLLGAILLALMGAHPWDAYREMARGAFGSVYSLSETLVKATPLLLAALGVGLAFRSGFWNIGAEGQLYMGAMGGTWIALAYPGVPAPLLQPLMIGVGCLAGAFWGLIPAVLRAYWRVNEIITTLMLNYIAILWVDFLVYGPWKDPKAFGFPFTPPLPQTARLPALPGSRVHLGLLLGLLAAALAGVLLSGIHAFLSISLHANQVGSGLALTIFGTGLTGLLGKSFVGVPAKGFAPVAVPWLDDVPLLGRIFFRHDPLVYITYLLVPALWVLLYRTRPGLKVRAVGEHPRGADTMGISVVAVRYGCVLTGGLAAGLGGAYLSLAYTQIWVDSMTAGRGWIALAIVIFGAWNPVRTALGAYLFGGMQALQLRLQAIGIAIPTYLLMMAPYAFTILALILTSGSRAQRRLGTPAALGTPYIRGA